MIIPPAVTEAFPRSDRSFARTGIPLLKISDESGSIIWTVQISAEYGISLSQFQSLLHPFAFIAFPAIFALDPSNLPNQTTKPKRRIFAAAESAAFAPSSHYLNKRKRLPFSKVHAAVVENDGGPKWRERNAGPNMIDIHLTQEFLSKLSQAEDKLVIVEFCGTWCASCQALFPKMTSLWCSLLCIQRYCRIKLQAQDLSIIRQINTKCTILEKLEKRLCRTAEEHPEILFLQVNFDENKPMCKTLNVKVLPYFHFYRGADGQLESFSCSLAKFQKIKDAIETHNTARCSIGPPRGVGDLNLLGASNTNGQACRSQFQIASHFVHFYS